MCSTMYLGAHIVIASLHGDSYALLAYLFDPEIERPAELEVFQMAISRGGLPTPL